MRLTPEQAIHACGEVPISKDDALVDMFLRMADSIGIPWRNLQYLSRGGLMKLAETELKRRNRSKVAHPWKDPFGLNKMWQAQMDGDLATFMHEMEIL